MTTLSLKQILAHLPTGEAAPLAKISDAIKPRPRMARTRRGLMRLVELGCVHRALTERGAEYSRTALPLLHDEEVSLDPPKGNDEQLDEKGDLKNNVLARPNKPYISVCPARPGSREKPGDNAALERAQRYDTVVAQARNWFLIAAEERAQHICDGIIDADDRHKDGAQRLQLLAMREAADMLERRIEAAEKRRAASQGAAE